jgi:hypothetical protein
MLLCISPGLGSTSSATLSLSGWLVGTTNYIAKYTPTGSGINNSQIFDNGTNVGIATNTPAFKLDVAWTGSFNGIRLAVGAMTGYVLVSDTTGNGIWRTPPTPCIVTWVWINNTCYWYSALQLNTTGNENTAYGNQSLQANTTWSWNTANWHQSLLSNRTGNQNSAYGKYSLRFNDSWANNTALGANTLTSNVAWSNNTSVWVDSLYNLVSWNNNTVYWYLWWFNLTNGANNTAIGSSTNFPNPTWSDQLNIANIIFGTNTNWSVWSPAGNIGIGTVAPGAKLEVAGQVKITGGAPWLGKVLTSDATGLATWMDTVSGSTAAGIVSGGWTQDYLSKFWPWGIGIYPSQLFDNGTNVGIGTISPGAKLEVAGQVKITGGSPGVNKVLASDATGLATWVSLSSVSGVWSLLGNSGTTAGANFVGTTDGQDLVFKTNNSEFMRALVSGNVGIW